MRLNSWLAFLIVTLTSAFLNLALHSEVRSSIRLKYPDDSFYTLSTPEAIGLALITTTLLLIILIASWFTAHSFIRKSKSSTAFTKVCLLLLNLLITVVVYQLCLSIAPQLFYTYYQFIFTDLPVQWVVKPITLERLLDRISLTSGASIAQHLAGFTVWVLVFNTTTQWLIYSVFAKIRISKTD